MRTRSVAPLLSSFLALLVWHTGQAVCHTFPGQSLHLHHHHGRQEDTSPGTEGGHHPLSRTLKQAAPAPAPDEAPVGIPAAPLPAVNLPAPKLGLGLIPAPSDDHSCATPLLKPGLVLATNIFFELLHAILPANATLSSIDAENLTAWRTILNDTESIIPVWPEAINIAKEYFNMSLPVLPAQLMLPKINVGSSRRRLLQTKDVMYTIPVNFIVVVPSSGNLVNDDNIAAQMEKLKSGFAGTGFAFKLNSTLYIQSNTWFTAEHNSDTDIFFKDTYRQGGPETLNVFVRKPQIPGLAEGYVLNGVAFFPQDLCQKGKQVSSRSTLDTVTIFYQTLPGVNPDVYRGATLVHEIGHWLGVGHTFNQPDSCNMQDGDGISDTPTEKYAYNKSPGFINGACNTQADSCPQLAGNDPVQNFMDYSPDTCRVLFTSQQILRMQWSYDSFRLSGKCSIPGQPESSPTTGQGAGAGAGTGTTGGSPRIRPSYLQSFLMILPALAPLLLCF
eukprot:TRINITY_DN18732_c0_g1_i1.p1 TRINITY_DN18732_c0_g1~~TRINITY_DN18732_c0_g1_i1.p1  ORF type:complete len:502 (+),score=53.98 TRINITY_DN18732_c0_g1_i1:152-1657(+)